MRRTYIPELVATLLLAAPLCAGMQQPGHASGASHSSPAPHSSPQSGGERGYSARPGGRQPEYGGRPGYSAGAPYRGPEAQPHFARPPRMGSAGSGARPGYGYVGSNGPQFGGHEAAARPQPGAPYAPYTVHPAPHQIYRGGGPHHGDWLRRTMQLPPQEQQRRLEEDQRFRQLPPERRQELLNRLQRFNALPPEERQRVLNRMEMIEHLPPQQQQEIHGLFHQFRDMDPERKDLIHRTLRQMRTMPPDARERFLNSPLTQGHFSPQEIQMLRGFNSIGFVGPEH